jgi:NADPH:quinone reductase-like Zn-dependent oxidoreductase
MISAEKLPEKMAAVLLTGHGGFEKLEYREDVPLPVISSRDVLIRVAAAAVNNTDINTRTGWYSKSVSNGTNTGGRNGFREANGRDSGWSGTALSFPLIQGADVCGHVVAVGDKVDSGRLGDRVIVRNLMRSPCSNRPYECWTFGSECNGGFAQYAAAPSVEAYTVNSDMSDVELSSFSCAYSTAENLLHRAKVKAGERILVTGASGGVGSAAVQLAKYRGATVTAVAGFNKAAAVGKLGADRVILRDHDLVYALGHDSVDVVIDLVAGSRWPQLLEVLKRGGRYAVAGAIAGPVVELDIRTLYLKDLTFYGCTFQEDIVFENLIRYIEKRRIKPVIAKTYPLEKIVEAQQDFLEKRQLGKLVLIPPKEL